MYFCRKKSLENRFYFEVALGKLSELIPVSSSKECLLTIEENWNVFCFVKIFSNSSIIGLLLKVFYYWMDLSSIYERF